MFGEGVEVIRFVKLGDQITGRGFPRFNGGHYNLLAAFNIHLQEVESVIIQKIPHIHRFDFNDISVTYQGGTFVFKNDPSEPVEDEVAPQADDDAEDGDE